LERYYLDEGENDNIRIELPKRSYIPIIRPDTMLREVSRSIISETPPALSTSDYGLSVAVIPFSAHPQIENLDSAYNITESIVSGMAQFRELNTVGPLVEYKDHALRADQIGRQYRVRFVLHGRVQLYGDSMRITAGLIDTRTGFKVWSHTYEYKRTATNLLEIEDDVSRLIVSTLADHSGIIPCLISRESMKKRLNGLDIHEAITLQSFHMKVLTLETHLAAVESLNHVLKSYPDNAFAMAMLGNAFCCNYLFDLGRENESLEEAERLVLRAINTDPECQIAHLTEGVLRFIQGQGDRCIAKLRVADLLNPFSAFALHTSGFLFCMLGHRQEAMSLWERGTHLNPNHSSFYFIVPFMNHYCNGDYQEAWNYAVRFNVPTFWDPVIRAAAAGQMGRSAEAEVALTELLKMRPYFPSRGRDLVRRLACLDENVELLMDGLFKAGLKINPV